MRICQLCNEYKKNVKFCDKCKKCVCDNCVIDYTTCSCNECKCM